MGSQPNWYQIASKTCYIPKICKFSVEKVYLCYVYVIYISTGKWGHLSVYRVYLPSVYLPELCRENVKNGSFFVFSADGNKKLVMVGVDFSPAYSKLKLEITIFMVPFP